MEIPALRGRILPPPLLRLLAALVEALLLRLADEVLLVLGRVPEGVVDGLEPLLGDAELLGLLPLLGAAVPDGLALGAALLLGLLAAGALAEGCEATGLFSANTGSVLAGRS